MQNPLTIRQMIDDVFHKLENASLTYGHGTDNPWDEAVALVFQVLHLPFDIDEGLLNRLLTRKEKGDVLAILDRRITEKLPLAYLIHEAYFAGLSFYIDERALIPRSPIAELINRKFSPWVKSEEVFSILDLCTGSGCIAIACAKAFPQVKVDAVDLSKDALAVAKINIERHKVQDRVNLIESNLFANLPSKKYDIIVSNPPYVSQKEMAELPKEYCHEPKFALESEDEGLEVVLKILDQAPNYMAEHSALIVEVGNGQQALEKRLPNVPFIWLEFEHGGEGVFLLRN
jgi:ribosomal protein L3 glutamine methyltransferase